MFTALPIARQEHAAHGAVEAEHPDTIETRLWLEEHEWLYSLLRSDDNVSPTFRFPDLISACVSLVFADEDAAPRIFDFLGTQLVLRSPHTPRRRESMCASSTTCCLRCSARRPTGTRTPSSNSTN